jgi:hypothetical protein
VEGSADRSTAADPSGWNLHPRARPQGLLRAADSIVFSKRQDGAVYAGSIDPKRIAAEWDRIVHLATSVHSSHASALSLRRVPHRAGRSNSRMDSMRNTCRRPGESSYRLASKSYGGQMLDCGTDTNISRIARGSIASAALDNDRCHSPRQPRSGEIPIRAPQLDHAHRQSKRPGNALATRKHDFPEQAWETLAGSIVQILQGIQ